MPSYSRTTFAVLTLSCVMVSAPGHAEITFSPSPVNTDDHVLFKLQVPPNHQVEYPVPGNILLTQNQTGNPIAVVEYPVPGSILQVQNQTGNPMPANINNAPSRSVWLLGNAAIALVSSCMLSFGFGYAFRSWRSQRRRMLASATKTGFHL
jgi:hypothetical protein